MEDNEYPSGEGNPFGDSTATAVADRKRVEETFGTKPEVETPRPKYGLSPAWAKSNEYKKPFDYYLEGSGQTVLLKRIDMGDMFKLGIAEQMDFMTKSLMTDADTKETPKANVTNAIMQSDNFDAMELMINKICLAGIIQPNVHPVPQKLVKDEKTEEEKYVDDPESKNPDVFYITDIPFQDRMELFTVIFDAEGLATFRSQQTVGMGNMENVPSVSLPAD